jgi:anti-sigma B factor antagonist
MTAPTPQQAPLPQLSARKRSGVTVVSLRGELDFLAVPALQAYLSDTRVRRRPRCVADLTGLAFIDCACLSVLVRYSREIQARGGSFALAGPQGEVRRVLSVTSPTTLFEVHDTVGQAVAGGRRPLVFAAARGRSRILARRRGFVPGPVQSGALLRDVIGATTAPRPARHGHDHVPGAIVRPAERPPEAPTGHRRRRVGTGSGAIAAVMTDVLATIFLRRH